ncbi:MAG: MYG1 family protein, partial [Bacteroidia bacterium]
MTKQQNIAMTHGGKFHADDVFSAALLKILNPQINIVRTFQVPDGFNGIVFDI